MNPTALLVLANAHRRRREDAAPREPFKSAASAQRLFGDADVVIGRLSTNDLATLRRLAEAVFEIADAIAEQRAPALHAVQQIDQLISASNGKLRLASTETGAKPYVHWIDAGPVAAVARRVVEELDQLEPGRLRKCEREACGLLFFDQTRSRTQRWHAENPCGWLERQHRRRVNARFVEVG